jgi:protoporphyrinogen/coproporphyrinogen III oxidase
VTANVQTLVVGGGISGLVCTYALRKAGLDAHLFEASVRPGGAIQSVARDGFLLELGPQSFSGTAPLRALFHNLAISDQLAEAPAHAPRYVFVDGALRPVPLSPPAFFASPLINVSTKWALVRDLFGKSVPPDHDETVAAFVRRKFSPQLLDRLVGPFVSGVYAGDPERLSLRSAFPALHEAEKSAGSIIRGMFRAAKTKTVPRERPTLLTLREGNESLVRALANALGPSLHTGRRITGLSVQNDGSFRVQFEANGATKSISTKSLILATPTNVSGKLLSSLDPSFESLFAPMEYAPVAVISLGYRKDDVSHPLAGFGFLVPRSSGLRVLGTVWNSSLFPGRAPAGHALLTTFAGGATDPSAAELSADALTRLVHREISPILSIAAAPVFSNVTVWPRALPQYNLGHSDRVATVARLLRNHPGIWLAGNYLRGPAIGSCVEQALAVAEEVREALET